MGRPTYTDEGIRNLFTAMVHGAVKDVTAPTGMPGYYQQHDNREEWEYRTAIQAADWLRENGLPFMQYIGIGVQPERFRQWLNRKEAEWVNRMLESLTG